jgi:hypothetical protein
VVARRQRWSGSWSRPDCVVHILLQIAFFRAVMVHHMGFKIHVTVGVDGRSPWHYPAHFAVLQARYGNGFINLRFLLFIGNRYRF